MSDKTNIGRSMRRFSSAQQFDGYSKVVIIVSDEIEYTAGSDTGRTMRLTCPWGTPEMAQDILDSVQGFRYQPYTAEDAFLDPAVELGDGVTANNVYGGVYARKLKFGPMLTATVAAPESEELDHEYPYKPKQSREVIRESKKLRAEMRIQSDLIALEIENRQNDVETLTGQLTAQAGLIEAKVARTGGSASSFGWALNDSSWRLQANSQDVLLATKNGLEVYGKITATSGKIGGFDIQSDHMSYNNQTWGGTNSTGIYLGPSGFQLGKNFKVDSMGNLTAYSGEFEGTVQAGNILYGGSNGTLSGSGISSASISGAKISSATLTTENMVSGINTSLGRADSAYNVISGVTTAIQINVETLKATTQVSAGKLYIGGVSVTKKSTTFKDGSGNNVTISYWG